MFMKKVGFITTLAAIFMLTATPAKAQEENGFKKFNVEEAFPSRCTPISLLVSTQCISVK
jgi:hypothetical protein